MSDEVLVSVVIPAYNAADCIGRAVESVLAQTLTDYEIIVVNDGSPDTEQLEAVLKPYASRIRYYKQENRGPSAARNRGTTVARGRYVGFLDADDTWLPEHLATQVSFLEGDPGLGLVYSDSVLLREGVVVGRTFERESQVLPVTFESLLEELCTVSLSTAVAKRVDLIDAGLFDERFVRSEDFDLWLRMAYRGTRMTHHSGANVRRTLSPGGLSSNEYLMRCARVEVLQKVGATMSLSQAQKALLAKRLEIAQAAVNLDRMKLLMDRGEFPAALDAAKQASAVLNTRKLRLAVIGLRWAPRLVHAWYKVNGQFLAVRNRRRRARYGQEETTVRLAKQPITTGLVTNETNTQGGALVNQAHR
ncbi:MAG TPA: glycosyltransferase family A protein [Dongiaceae bacterium]|nr:glycosyltransferase family A protein [Dongiaceae bacterium]